VSFAVCAYPTISDRVRNTKDGLCQFLAAENEKFIIAIILLGYHIPCIVIVVCYVIVFFEIRKLFKVRPGAKLESLFLVMLADVFMALAIAAPPPSTLPSDAALALAGAAGLAPVRTLNSYALGPSRLQQLKPKPHPKPMLKAAAVLP